VDEQTKPFWSCLLTRDVALDALQNGQQIRRLVEQAYGGEKAQFPDHLLADCVPAMARARQQAAALPAPPPALRDPLATYLASLANIEAALRLYGERLKSRESVKKVDEEMAAQAKAWHEAPRPTPETIAYDRFLHCAVPELDALASGQALYDHLARRCFEQNPLPFIERVRRECGPLLREREQRATGTYRTTQKRLRDAEGREAQSWESCTDLARAQRRMQDADELVAAAEHYLEARRAMKGGGVRTTAR
jgi:hypothetical protein